MEIKKRRRGPDQENQPKPEMVKSEKVPNKEQPNNPLHGIKLVDILEFLVKKYGWDGLGNRIDIRCFKYDPSIKSSLHFLRRTPWARQQVEELYLKAIS